MEEESVRRFAFHFQFGMGMIDSINGNIANVKFKDGMKSILSPTDLDSNPFLKVLSSDFSKYILNHKFDVLFPLPVQERSMVLESDFESFSVTSGNEIEGDVISSNGVDSYHVRAVLKKESLSTICSCPVGNNCKHAYRLLSDFSQLTFEEEISNAIFQRYLFQLQKMSAKNINKYFLSSIPELTSFRTNMEKGLSLSFLEKFNDAIAIDKHMHYKKMASLLTLFRNKEAILRKYIETCHNRPNPLTKALEESFQKRDDPELYEGEFCRIVDAFLNDDYEGMLREYFAIGSWYNDCSPLFNLCIPNIKDLNPCYTYIKRFFRAYYNISNDANKSLLTSLDTNYLVELATLGNSSFKLDSENFSLEHKIVLFPTMSLSERESFVDQNFEILSSQQYVMSFIASLFKLVEALPYYSRNPTEEPYRYLLKLKEAPYFAAALLGIKKRSIEVKNQTRLLHSHYSLIEEKKEKLDDYYSYDVKLEEYQGTDTFTFSYEIQIAKDPSLSISFRLDSEDREIDYYHKTVRPFFQLLFDRCKLVTEEKRKALEEAQNRKIQENIRQRKKTRLAYYLTETQIEENEKIQNSLISPKNVTLIPRLNTSGYIDCSIGKERIYKIKNISDFLLAFRNHQVVDFSKYFSFACEKENLTEFSEKIFDILEKESYVDPQNPKFTKLSKQGRDDLLSLYLGKQLIINDASYFISDEEVQVRYSLDENKVLHIDPILNEDSFIEGEKRDYFLDRTTMKAFEIKDAKKNSSLNHFFQEFNGIDIEGQEQLFIDGIYESHKDQIQIPETLNLYKNVTIERINLFLDMEDEVIHQNITVSRDEVTIPIGSCRKETKSKLRVLTTFLENLGFKGNQLSSQEDIYNLLTMDFSKIQSLCNVYLADTIKGKNIVPFPKQTYHISYNNSMMSVFNEDSSFSEEELRSIFNAIKKKKKFIQLRDKTILDLTGEEADEFFEITNDLKLDPKNLRKAQDVPFYNSFKVANLLNKSNIHEFLSNAINDISHFKEKQLELPPVNATLRNYQIDGVKWLQTLKEYHLSGILADDMGLGKTLETITFLMLDNTPKPSLIVCPKSLIFNWISEFQKFSPEMKVVKIYGTQIERNDIIASIKDDEKVIYITSYDSLRNDQQYYKGKMQFLILDEAQAIKTFTAKKSISVKKLDSEYRFVLTGTPIENNVLELWSIFDFLMPGFLEPIETFKSRFENEQDYKEKIAKQVALFILRRVKSEVLKDLPEKSERILTSEMTTEQQRIYAAYCQAAKDKLATGGKAFDVLPILTRLRQVCVDPRMFVEDYHGGSGKMEVLDETITSLLQGGHKILIFSQFVKGLNLIEELLVQKGIPYYLLTGDTKAEDRVELCNKFNDKNNDVSIFLISLKAGGNGLNLVGADSVIHLDPWWNSAAENQATDRAHRIGQTRNVEVIKIICENTIEQRVIELQNLKKDLIDSLIANDDKAITTMSKEDLSFLLE